MQFLKLEEMTVEQKVGMVLCARRFWNDDDKNFILKLVKERALGCMQVPLWDVEFAKKVKENSFSSRFGSSLGRLQALRHARSSRHLESP